MDDCVIESEFVGEMDDWVVKSRNSNWVRNTRNFTVHQRYGWETGQ